MKLTSIEIENFKSIKKRTIDVEKHGGSYTTMFLGINESGKSNLLQAISFLMPYKQNSISKAFAIKKKKTKNL